MTFNAQAYWSKRQRKKFVVTVDGGTEFCSFKTEERIVAAERMEDACEKAVDLSFLPYPRVSGVRLATPDDLGCEAAA